MEKSQIIESLLIQFKHWTKSLILLVIHSNQKSVIFVTRLIMEKVTFVSTMDDAYVCKFHQKTINLLKCVAFLQESYRNEILMEIHALSQI